MTVCPFITKILDGSQYWGNRKCLFCTKPTFFIQNTFQARFYFINLKLNFRRKYLHVGSISMGQWVKECNFNNESACWVRTVLEGAVRVVPMSMAILSRSSRNTLNSCISMGPSSILQYSLGNRHQCAHCY